MIKMILISAVIGGLILLITAAYCRMVRTGKEADRMLRTLSAPELSLQTADGKELERVRGSVEVTETMIKIFDPEGAPLIVANAKDYKVEVCSNGTMQPVLLER